MIVVSGLLVLVALVLLVIGLFGSGLGLIWASIITSVVAGVFLLLGALQRRGEAPRAAESGGATGSEMLDRVTAVSVRPREDAPAEDAGMPASSGPTVSVVPGRPRYHVASCRFLAGRPDVEEIALDMAQGEGYTACGVCKPDQAIAAAAETAPSPEPEAEPEAEESTVDVEETAVLAETPAPGRARKAPAKKAAAATKSTATKATASKATATKATKAAAKPAAGTSTVVVIPDRGKFHTETCRFVKDVPGTVSLAKTAAKRQGYTPCGVCKP